MISADDRLRMAATLTAVREDREEELTFRRGMETVGPVKVRVARIGGQSRLPESEGGAQSEGRVVVLAPVGTDIRAGDRFTDSNGVTYTLSFVRPNRDVAIMAEGMIVQ